MQNRQGIPVSSKHQNMGTPAGALLPAVRAVVPAALPSATGTNVVAHPRHHANQRLIPLLRGTEVEGNM